MRHVSALAREFNADPEAADAMGAFVGALDDDAFDRLLGSMVGRMVSGTGPAVDVGFLLKSIGHRCPAAHRETIWPDVEETIQPDLRNRGQRLRATTLVPFGVERLISDDELRQRVELPISIFEHHRLDLRRELEAGIGPNPIPRVEGLQTQLQQVCEWIVRGGHLIRPPPDFVGPVAHGIFDPVGPTD